MIEHMYSVCDCRVGQNRFLVVFARVVGVRPCVCVLFIYAYYLFISVLLGEDGLGIRYWLERMYLGLAHCAGYRGCVLD